MWLGLDLGTQSLKAVICDDGMTPRGHGAVTYPIAYPRPAWAEQDPAHWLAALAPAIARALGGAKLPPTAIRGIGVSGQLDGCVPTDLDNHALGPCLPWLDRRAADALPSLAAHACLAPDTFASITGQILDASHMAAKIRWLDRERPGAARFHQPVSFLVAQLTGRAVLDPAQASTTMLWDLAARSFSPALLSAFAIDPARLPAIERADAIAGVLTARGATLTGLPAGIPVAVGTGDDFATPLGAGIATPGAVIDVLGTAEVVGALSPALTIDRTHSPLVETHAYPAPGYFVEHPGWLAGGALTWLGELLAEADPAALDALAAPIAPGADELSFLPALTGAMTPAWHAGARGAFYGLTPAHGRGHLVRAVLEACAFGARDVIERLDALGVATDHVILAGGGSRSRLWAQLRADVTGRVHHIAAHRDTCAIGAAMLAAVAAGAIPDLLTAAQLAPPPIEIVHPDPSAAAACAAAHGRYRRLFDALRPLF
ncbi:MAG: hypothetical protein K8W52_16455 [Deltaproteobacteria bacterium]|nr:hypothetical protein [Deltaproteobacteria bacterium]